MTARHATGARSGRGAERPVCSRHGLAMLVGRTVGSLQYRYCRVQGCQESQVTSRDAAPHKRWPPRNDPTQG